MSVNSAKDLVPEYLSHKIRSLMFFTTEMVVLVHSYNYTDSFLQPTTKLSEGLYFPAMIEFFFSNALNRFVNPLFFAISGYLFFVGIEKFTVKLYVNKLKKRVISLLTPYVFWVFFWTFIGLMIVNIVGSSHFPLLAEKFENWPVSPFGSMYHSPVPFQFWFIKDLFKLVLLSPVIYFFVKKLGKYAIVLLFIPWLMDISFPYMPYCDGLISFTIGCYCAVYGLDRKYMTSPLCALKLAVFPIIWILLCIGYTFVSAIGEEIGINDITLLLLYKGCVAFGFLSVFTLYDFFYRRKSFSDNKFTLALKKSSFMVFCIHEPLQHFVFQGVVTPDTSIAMHLLLYFGLPIVFISFGVLVNQLISKVSPGLHQFLTGNR